MRRLIQHGGKAFRGSNLQQRIVTGALMRHGLTKRVAWPGKIKSAGIRAPSARAKTAVSRGFVSHSPGVSASRPKIQTPGAYATDPGSGERLCEACQERVSLLTISSLASRITKRLTMLSMPRNHGSGFIEEEPNKHLGILAP
jgi:hypothetical protein